MPDNQTVLIIQAIESAEKNLALAKKLLGSEGVSGPGIVGEFEGEFMVTKEGRRHQIPPNYASKSRLVVGDSLRLIGSGKEAIFKQIRKVERLKTSGVLSKKDGQWTAVTEAGSFLVLPVSVNYFNGEIGDEVEVIIPKDYKKIKPKWAALEQVVKPVTTKKPATTPKMAAPTGEVKKPEIPNPPLAGKKPKTPKKTVTPLRPAVGRTSEGQATETRKETEAQKKELPKEPKILKQPKEPKVKGEPPKAVKSEIKVEEELR